MNSTKLYDRPEAMAPMTPGIDGRLQGLAEQACNRANRLNGRLHPLTANAVAAFLRPMNCYYSNLIEGHPTTPLDIERAMRNEYATDPRKRNLQLEAHAHITTQERMYDRLQQTAPVPKAANPNPYEPAFWQWLHEVFYEHLPDDFQIVESKGGALWRVIPGQLRTQEVEVGLHQGPQAAALPAFVAHFAWFYKPARTFSQVERIVHVAAAHHRFAWIHPFLDGNGRIGRLLSEAAFQTEGLTGPGLWSVSRGLARRQDEYKARLANADSQRYGDNDGRGNLLEKALREFCVFFLETALDQLDFMERALNTDTMLSRLLALAELLVTQRRVPKQARYVLEEVFLRGQISRRELPRLVGKSENTARGIANQLIDLGLLTTGGRFSAYQVRYPVSFSPILFPELYPQGEEVSLWQNIQLSGLHT